MMKHKNALPHKVTSLHRIKQNINIQKQTKLNIFKVTNLYYETIKKNTIQKTHNQHEIHKWE